MGISSLLFYLYYYFSLTCKIINYSCTIPIRNSQIIPLKLKKEILYDGHNHNIETFILYSRRIFAFFFFVVAVARRLLLLLLWQGRVAHHSHLLYGGEEGDEDIYFLSCHLCKTNIYSAYEAIIICRQGRDAHHHHDDCCLTFSTGEKKEMMRAVGVSIFPATSFIIRRHELGDIFANLRIYYYAAAGERCPSLLLLLLYGGESSEVSGLVLFFSLPCFYLFLCVKCNERYK